MDIKRATKMLKDACEDGHPALIEACNMVCTYAVEYQTLYRLYERTKNALCLYCGQYKQRHLGVCDGCIHHKPTAQTVTDKLLEEAGFEL